jgi:glycosyltransferase involved in cell wall biosynthesis
VKAWIVFIGEELPTDGAVRPWRYGILSDILADRGHEVVRWQPSFYLHKIQRCEADTTIRWRENYTIRLIHVPPYRRPIGLQRIRHYELLARRFSALAREETPPDIVLCGMPSPSLCAASLDYGLARNVPVLIDVRDLWPDIFLDVVPPFLRPLGRLALGPEFRRNRRVFRQATGILGIRDDFVQWGLDYGGRARGPYDATFTHAYKERVLQTEERRREEESLRRAGVRFDRPLACFFGSFEESYDLETVVEAARLLAAGPSGNLQFVLCGDGKKLPALRVRAEGLPNVVLPGRVTPEAIARLMEAADFGLASFIRGATHTVSNKVVEYFCGGLAVVASESEGIRRVLEANRCGATYEPERPQDLAALLADLMANGERREEMKANSRALYERSYTAEAVYGRMADHLEETVRRFREEGGRTIP